MGVLIVVAVLAGIVGLFTFLLNALAEESALWLARNRGSSIGLRDPAEVWPDKPHRRLARTVRMHRGR